MRSLDKNGRPLIGAEKRYGRNEWENLELCPRCVCANPVKIELDFNRQVIRLLCKKCLTLGHVDGALIKEIPMEPHDPRRIMDG